MVVNLGFPIGDSFSPLCSAIILLNVIECTLGHQLGAATEEETGCSSEHH